MARFLLKGLLFLAPLGALFAFPLFVYWQAREFMPAESIAAAQRGRAQVLCGFAYSNITSTYKKSLIAGTNPEIVVLGSSHVMGFRRSFFLPAALFINGGGTIPNGDLEDTAGYIRKLPPDSRLSVVLLNLDPWQLTLPHQAAPPEDLTKAERLGTLLRINWRKVYSDYFSGKFSLRDLPWSSHNSAIGLNALVNREGFLNDGSYFYGRAVEDPEHSADVNRQIIAGKIAHVQADRSTLDFGTTLLPENLEALRTLLELFKKRNIHVIGFIPPYPHSIYRELMSQDDAHSDLVRKQSKLLADTFNAYRFSFIDYTDAASAHIPDSEFVDGTHFTDKASLRMLIDMTRHDTVLERYVSLPGLSALLDSVKNRDFILTQIDTEN
jgi:hypothetical protein